MPKGTDLQIVKQINYSEIDWNNVHKALVKKFKLDYGQVSSLISRFIKNFSTPLNSYWFKKSKISASDKKVILILAEIYACDRLIIKTSKKIKLFFLSFEYSFSLELIPVLKKNDFEDSQKASQQIPEAHLKIFDFDFRLRNIKELIFCQILLFIFAVILYVGIYGAILYITSVFILFAYTPFDLLRAALNRAEFGLVLLFGLVGLAAAFSKAVKNIFSLIKQGGFKNADA